MIFEIWSFSKNFFFWGFDFQMPYESWLKLSFKCVQQIVFILFLSSYVRFWPKFILKASIKVFPWLTVNETDQK